MKPISVIGLGLSPRDLTSEHEHIIHNADILIAGKRHLEFFKDHPGLKKEITANIQDVIQFIRDHMQTHSITVISSGDPLFFGIGSALIRALGPAPVCIYPNISTVAAAFSRIKSSWDDARIVSLHGKNRQGELLDVLLKNDKVAVYTDPHRNPAWLAQFLLAEGVSGFEMWVLEQLGTDSERVARFELAQVSEKHFADPNLVVLMRRPALEAPCPALQLGLPDRFYEHERGLITKPEVRAVTLSKLRLCSEHILWDLGAGSGSVAIEAALFITQGKIYAVEKKKNRIRQIENNQKRFKVENLSTVQATLPAGLENLPRPDRIFIGGGGRDLAGIITSAAARIKEGGIMVINTVILSNVGVAITELEKIGFTIDVTQVQINRRKPMPRGERLQAENPVWIISGIRTVFNSDGGEK